MNRSTLVLVTLLAAAPAFGQVGISVDIVQPGVYGRIEIGSRPPPVVYAQPVIIAPAPRAGRPLYLYVPPGHQKKWGKHCARYDACGRPVYFVREDWVEARYEERHHGPHGEGHGGPKGKGHGKGNGNGKGNGHGKHGH